MPTDPQHPQDEPEVWPPHTGEGPDVSNLGNEAETEDNPRYDPVD